MHALVYHVPGFIKQHKNFKQFTGQGTEKTMMMLKEYIFENQINGMWQKATLVLLECRQRALRKREKSLSKEQQSSLEQRYN